MIEIQERTDRQERINGWKQKKLDDLVVTITGAGPLSNFVLANLSGLQVGKIRIIDDKYYNNDINEFLFFDYYKKKERISKVEHIEKIISQMNKKIEVMGIHSEPFYTLFGPEKPKILLDLTNDPESKLNSIEISDKLNTPLITASTSENKGRLMLYNQISKMEKIVTGAASRKKEDYLFLDYENSKQGNIPSGLIAGLITEEIRKYVLQLIEGDYMLKKEFNYNLLSDKMFNNPENISLDIKDYLKEKELFKNKKVTVIGAGAVGNFVGLGLSLLGVGQIYLIDMDYIDATNPNRQVISNFENNVGKKKVDILSKSLNKINPDIRITGIYGKLDKNLSAKEKNENIKLIDESAILNLNSDLVIGGVDSFASRAVINEIVVRNKIPYIDASTDPFSAILTTYIPGKTACLDCQTNVYKLAEEEKRRNEAISSCTADNHEPSVVMSNQIISAVAVGMTKKILHPNIYGAPPKGQIYYNSISSRRVSLSSKSTKSKKGCPCNK